MRKHGIPFDLAGRHFASKQAVLNELLAIKNRAADYVPITNPQDVALLAALLEIHPSYRQKVTQEDVVTGFMVIPVHSGRGFRILLQGGSPEGVEIAPDKALRSETSIENERISDAFRNAVHDQIVEFKEQQGFGRVSCAHCPAVVENRHWRTNVVDPTLQPAHVDHNKNHRRMTDLIQDFQKIYPEAVNPPRERQPNPYGPVPENQWVLSPGQLRDTWSQYHREHAVLRFLCPACNMSEQ